MDSEEKRPWRSKVPKNPKLTSPPLYRLIDGTASPPSVWFEIRLFYVRISPCIVDAVPDHIILRPLRSMTGVSLEINGRHVPASETTSLTLRCDRIDKESSEVTYITTDAVRVTGTIDFEVYENEELIICGSLEKMESHWNTVGNGFDYNHHQGLDSDSKTGWSMDCYSAAWTAVSSSAFFRPKLGIASPSIELYVAGCCSGFPLILTKTIQLSPRRKASRYGTLDSIPEVNETVRDQMRINGFLPHSIVEDTEGEIDECDSERKIRCNFYPEDGYFDDDGQLSLFNAGVRVGVGIGLGMFLGIGIGIGLLMRSYQATTKTFKRRYF